jgi:hypothetical protein
VSQGWALCLSRSQSDVICWVKGSARIYLHLDGTVTLSVDEVWVDKLFDTFEEAAQCAEA